jgi:hypothetical protein
MENTEKKKLEGLLYRKGVTESLMTVWQKGIKTYNELREQCMIVASDETRTDLERSQAKVRIHEIDAPLKHYITSFKLSKREYENFIIPEIEKLVSEEDKEIIGFVDLEAQARELANIEVFGHGKQPENVELNDVAKSLSQHIELLKNIIEQINDRINTSSDEYEKAVLKMDLFKHNLHFISNKKRLAERIDYYNNQFLPKYNKDMEEADRLLDKYLDRAKELIALGVDIKLQFLIDEYEKNKADKEKVWLFYTALKSRINKISKEMRKNKSTFKGKMHLAEEIS